MNPICFEQACCIFYCLEYNDVNVKTCTDRVKKMEDVQICYIQNPDEPDIVCNARVFGAPNLYKRYKLKEDLEEEKENDMNENITFEHESQIVESINYVYRPKSEHAKDSPFQLTKVSDKTVLGVLYKYTDRFNKTTALGFNRWLKKQNIDFLLQEPERKVLKLDKSEKLRTRDLSVLPSQFHGKVENGVIGQDNVLTPVLFSASIVLSSSASIVLSSTAF